MCAAFSPLQTCPAKKDSLFHRGHPGLQYLAFAGPAGPAFFFLPCPSFSQRFLSEWGQRWFSLAWTSLVSFPYLSSIPHTALHRPSCGFVSQNEVTPPTKGGGAGFYSTWSCSASLGSCPWQLLATTGSRWPNRAGLRLRWYRFPTCPPKVAHRLSRGEFCFHFLVLLLFLVGSPANCRSRW